MRILQVTPFFAESYGGTERYSYFLSNALADRGHDVEVYTSRLYKGVYNPRLRPNLLVHRYVTLGSVWKINPLAVILPSLIWNAADYDVIHAHSFLYFTSNQVALAKIYRSYFNMRTPPVLLQIHGGIGIPKALKIPRYKKTTKRLYDNSIGSMTIHAADAILTMSKIEKEQILENFKVDENQILLLPNAVLDETLDLARFKRLDYEKDVFTLIYAGDLEPWKAVDDLITALKIVRKKIDNIELMIVGEGTQKKKLEKMARGLPVWFTGYLPHKQALIRIAEANAFVMPSIWEGLPTVILEAMAAKTPVISTSVGAIPEVVKDEETGLLVEPANPKALADAIYKLWKNQDLAEEIMNKSYNKVKRQYTFSRVARYAEHIYRHMINIR